jgi:signal transduction histidine kinase
MFLPRRDEEGRGESRGGYLGFVAHEVRNPLATALWTAELLTRMPPDERAGARGDKLAAMCLRSLGRVRQLVEDHLLIERLDAGGLPVRPEPVSVGEALDAVVARLPGLTISAEVPPGLAASADRALLERALDAILRAASRDGVAVRVEARAAGPVAEIRVAGAPPGEGALDDPRKGTASDPRGSALGLAAARRIGAAFRGKLAVDGQAYLLVLPRAEAPPADGGRPEDR